MRKVVMLLSALALVAPALRAQQEDRDAATRRELEQKMRELERQMRELQRDMATLSPPARAGRAPSPLIRVYTNRAYLGVNVATEKNPATDSVGAVLAAVTPGGPADEVGLKAGDILTSFNKETLTGLYPAVDAGPPFPDRWSASNESEPGMKLVHLARELEDGDTVRVSYRRGKETRQATIVARTLDTKEWGFTVTPLVPPRIDVEAPMAGAFREMMQPALAGGLGFSYGRWLDLELVALNPELGNYFGTNEGLLVIRAPDDSLLGLKGGDVILSVDGRKPGSQAQLMRILRSYAPGEDVRLDIMRQKRRTTVAAKIPERRRYDWDWDSRR